MTGKRHFPKLLLIHSLALFLLAGTLYAGGAPAADDVHGTWEIMTRENAGMRIQTTLTVHEDSISVSNRCSYGEKVVLATATVAAKIDEKQIAPQEGKTVEEEYSPGFLVCKATVKNSVMPYRMEDGKLVLIDPDRGKTLALSRLPD